MKCAKCGHYISKPSALSNGMPVGPVCAMRLGLSQPRKKRARILGIAIRPVRSRRTVDQAGQLALFEVVPA